MNTNLTKGDLMDQDHVRQVEVTVMELAAKQVGVPVTDLTRGGHIRDDLNFDSLVVVDLTMGLEESFGLSISDADAEPLQTVGAVVDYVVERTRSAAAPATGA